MIIFTDETLLKMKSFYLVGFLQSTSYIVHLQVTLKGGQAMILKSNNLFKSILSLQLKIKQMDKVFFNLQ